MARRRSGTAASTQLRLAIDCLPTQTRVAMLEGVRSQPIIVGAYVDRHGGVCPMLAAHRCGGRTNFLGFARAWDRFTGAGKRARRASERELRILVAQLESSLLADESVDLKQAIAEHRTSRAVTQTVEHTDRGDERNGDRATAEPSSPLTITAASNGNTRRNGAGNGHASRSARNGHASDRDRTTELQNRDGWAWLRPFRHYDDFERALELVEAERDALAARKRDPERA